MNSSRFLESVDRSLGLDQQLGCCEFGGRGFDFRDYFLLSLPSSRLSGYCRFRHRLFRPGRLPCGCHFMLFVFLRERLRRGIGIWGWSDGGLDNMPSDDVIPSFAQVYLRVGGPDPLRFGASA